MNTSIFIKALASLAAFWHVVAFAAGIVFVWQSYRALFGLSIRQSAWSRIIQQADLHLWLSGFAIIALGILLEGLDRYLDNPKLWVKVSLVLVWLLSTQILRRVAGPLLRKGLRTPMVTAASVSLACWIYGTFLGVARPLAHGAVSWSALGLGFLAVMLTSLLVSLAMDKRFGQLAREG